MKTARLPIDMANSAGAVGGEACNCLSTKSFIITKSGTKHSSGKQQRAGTDSEKRDHTDELRSCDKPIHAKQRAMRQQTKRIRPKQPQVAATMAAAASKGRASHEACVDSRKSVNIGLGPPAKPESSSTDVATLLPSLSVPLSSSQEVHFAIQHFAVLL